MRALPTRQLATPEACVASSVSRNAAGEIGRFSGETTPTGRNNSASLLATRRSIRRRLLMYQST